MITKIIKSVAVSVCAAAMMLGVAVAPAQAANQDRVRETGEVVYYYSPNLRGAWSDFSINVRSLSDYTFIGGAGLPGHGEEVRNNAASITNYHRSLMVTVYYSPGWTGSWVRANPSTSRNLDHLRNDNASHWFG